MATISPAISINKTPNLVIAYSSGVDSVAIAHYCRKWNPMLIHFNHKLRPQNDEMENRAIQFALKYGLTLIVRRREDEFTVGGSMEAEARDMRLNAFKSAFESANIIVAHHLNDACESYLMNVLRGHEGRIPIPIETELSPTIKLIRPFMTTPKKALCQYVEEHQLGQYVVEDETNGDESMKRNFIRGTLIPTIEQQYGLEKVVLKKMLNFYNKF